MTTKSVTGPTPEYINQKKPHPTQGVLTRTSAQKDVPYKSGPATPNKRVK